ncbi:MAG: hypothetical protein ACEPO8_06070 [Rhodothermaceae bacterium]
MKQKIIRLLAKKDEIKIIKSIFRKFEVHMPTMKVASKKIGELSDRAVVSIKINPENQAKLIEVFLINGLKVLAVDDENKKLIDSIKRKLKEGLIDKEAEKSKESVRLASLPISEERLNEFAESGDYEAIKDVSKDIINFSENFVGKISELLSRAVANAIDNEVMNALDGKEAARKSIQNLMNIASDQTLRSFHKRDLRVRAGESAIEICQHNIGCMHFLIDIANQKNIPNEINVISAIRFAEVVLEDVDFFEDEVEYVRKNLNAKWLEMAFDVAVKSLTFAEKTVYKKLLNFVKNKV